MTIPRDIHAAEPIFSYEARIAGAALRFSRFICGVGGASDVILCTTEDGREVVALASEWPREDRCGASRGQPGTVTRTSSDSQKIALYRSLFRGREDAYANSYLRKDGRMGYSPACSNAWKPGLCDRRHVGCDKCGNRSLHALDDDALKRHFKGVDPRNRDVVGLYPMTEASTCWLLVADFDDDGWQEAACAYRDACRRRGLDCAVERSRSGHGAHVWLFFEEAIPAREARALGTLLLDDARRHCSKLGFGSYDRLFPTQDTISSDGLGNLIALPLQGAAVRKGNSVFVDDAFSPYADQWTFLSSVKKVPVAMARELLESGGTAPAGASDAEAAMPPNVVVSVGGMIALDKGALPQTAIADLSRLAAMANPEFFLKQRMHQKIYPAKTPRYLWFGEEDEAELRLPRGCLRDAVKYLHERGVKTQIRDCRTEGHAPHARFAGSFRPGQREALNALAEHDDGILVAPTGFGKTVIAAGLIAEKGVNTLVLVPKSSLLEQWRESLCKFLQIDDEAPTLLTPTGRKARHQPGKVGVIGGGKRLPSGLVDIALVPSLIEGGAVPGDRRVSELVSSYGMVLVDEAQHVPASGLVEVLKASGARYVFGLTATPKRKDKLERALQLFLGPVRMKVQGNGQSTAGGVSRVLVPRFTGVRLPEDVDAGDWNALLDLVCKHEERNALIARDACDAVLQGRYPIVLTRRVEHAKTLSSLIEKRLQQEWRATGTEGAGEPSVITLVGSDDARARRERLEQLRKLPPERIACIVATDSYVGEGFDEPRLDTLLLAAPVAWEGLLTQLVGRIQRDLPGKRSPQVYDYVDELVPLLARQWHERLKAYARLGYVVEGPEANGVENHIVTAGPAAMELLRRDVKSARAEITLVSAWVVSKAVGAIAPALVAAVSRGVSVTVVARTRDDAGDVDACLDELEEAGCKVKHGKRRVPNSAVFDGSLVWFGGIPPLAFAHADDCSIRIVNRELAAELEGAL